MTTTLVLGLAIAFAVRPAAESVTYDAYTLRGDGGRELVAHGVRTYSPTCDIRVRPLTTSAWDKSLLLDGGFAIAANVYREPRLTGFGITVDQPGRSGFSWEWFDIEQGNVFQKLQGPGRLAVEVAKGPGYEELRSIEFLEDVTLRYRDDAVSRSPGAHTHEVVVRKGSVLRLAPAEATPAAACPSPDPAATAREGAARATPEAPPDISEVQMWMTYYYLKPSPERTLASLDLMETELQKAGSSLAEQATRGGMRSFYARVLARNDAVAAEAAKKLPALPPGQQTFLREALRRCGTPVCGKAVGPAPPRPDRQPDPGTLDDAWASFFATGEAKYVREIIAVLPWIEVRGDVDRMMTGGAARWSLASNAYQHARVLAIAEESVAGASEPTKTLLQQVVEEAKAERARNPPPEPFR